MVTLEMLAAELSVFVRVEVIVLELPTVVLGNVSFVGLKTSGACPLPYVLISCGFVEASSVISTWPFSVLTASGVKVMVTVQLAFAASDLPQVLVAVYCDCLGRMLVMFRVLSPVFVIVRVRGALVTPTATDPKSAL